MEAAARADGVTLIINGAFRSSTEQAALFARNPDAKWVAPPGRSLHRLGTESTSAPAAYAWLAGNGESFHFTQRYSWPRVGSVRPSRPRTLDERAKLWHPGTRVTVPEQQPECRLSQLKES